MRCPCKLRTAPSLHQTPHPSSVPASMQSLVARNGGQLWPQRRRAPPRLVLHGCARVGMCSALKRAIKHRNLSFHPTFWTTMITHTLSASRHGY
jgi:hypothetical protein